MYYDKDKIKEQITPDMVFQFVQDLGGEPRWFPGGFVAATICHNLPGCGSHKLYYYNNSRLFRCYTGCDCSFDIFDLFNKHFKIIHPGSNPSLYDSVAYISNLFGFDNSLDLPDISQLDDWNALKKYDTINEKEFKPFTAIVLPKYNSNILKYLSYPKIIDWEKEDILPRIIKKNQIGYYPVDEQITIPHFDIDGNFCGLRGRALGRQQAEDFGKYRPIKIGNILYNHPLGFNLYNLNNSKNNIHKYKKAIIFEGEKSCLKYQSYFGEDNDISTACCGSAVSDTQINLLLNLDVKEIIIAFDKQFQEKGDIEFKHLVENLKKIHLKYSKFVQISFIFDKSDVLGYKDAPIDKGKEIFFQLYKERFSL